MAAASALHSKPHEFDTRTGVNRDTRADLAKLLAASLSDLYLLYLKTQNFHWNVVGPTFYGVHKLTESQYQAMAEAIDTIAERIRALGFTAPGSFKQFIQLASIKEETGVPSAHEMIAQLAADNEYYAKRLRTTIKFADDLGDAKTADLMTDEMGRHEENAWMLRSMLA